MGNLIFFHRGEQVGSLEVVSILKLVITTEITGYTCLRIYGKINDLKYKSIVVPTYKLEVKKDDKLITTYNVTRDSWYCRGLLSNKKDCELSNRCFEPADGKKNLYSTVPTAYPYNAGLDAYALRQNGSEYLKAVAHTKKMQTYTDNTDIDDARKKLDETNGIMIHIGGWFENSGTQKLAGSYGCFGIVPKAQIRTTKENAEKDRVNKGYEKFDSANDAYKKAMKFIVHNCHPKTTPQVLIEKRDSVEQFRTINKDK